MKSKNELHKIMKLPLVNEMYDVQSREWLIAVCLQEEEDLESYHHSLKLSMKHIKNMLIMDYQDSTVKFNEDSLKAETLLYANERLYKNICDSYYYLNEMLIEVEDIRLNDFKIKKLKEQNDLIESECRIMSHEIRELKKELAKLKEKNQLVNG